MCAYNLKPYKPKQKTVKGYKLVYRIGKSGTKFESLHAFSRYEIGKWYKAKKVLALVTTNQSYKAGFHAYPSLRAANWERSSWYWDNEICVEVELKGNVRIGTSGPFNHTKQLVADYMRIVKVVASKH